MYLHQLTLRKICRVMSGLRHKLAAIGKRYQQSNRHSELQRQRSGVIKKAHGLAAHRNQKTTEKIAVSDILCFNVTKVEPDYWGNSMVKVDAELRFWNGRKETVTLMLPNGALLDVLHGEML